MNPVYTAALEAQRFFKKKRWRFCLIGGVAVTRWGEPRSTRDADFTLLIELRKEREIIDTILAHFGEREPGAGAFAGQSRVLLCNASKEWH